jgi:GWxTD domain-containing protein
MRKYILLFIVFSASLYADLKVITDSNRFLDIDSNTILEIVYEIPYTEMQFIKTSNGFEAQLKTDLKIFSGDQEVYQQDFTNLIILTNQEMTESDGNFLDKITLTLAKSDFRISLDFIDVLSEKTTWWEHLFTMLNSDALISDLEISYEVTKDTTEYLQKFHRWDYLFVNNPSHIFDLKKYKVLNLYFEIGNFFKDIEDNSDLTEIISIYKNNELISQEESAIKENKDLINRIKQLDLQLLQPGYYQLEVTIIDNISSYQEVKQDFFSIKNNPSLTVRLFPDLEDEFRLVKYFLNSSQIKVWKDLTVSGKNNFLNRFWELYDSNPQTEKNEFFDEIKQRVEYTDQNFSHHEPGWTTDRGRIYIRNGKPDEVLKERTGFYTKYATKDYEIWKYRRGEIQTYIFIDLMTSGNYKMIYSDNDDREITLPDWQNYLDSDFDETVLE